MVEQKALKKANDTSKRYLGNIADDYVFLENKSKSQQDCIGIKGGRYDTLIKDLGFKKNIPAVGAAINLKQT